MKQLKFSFLLIVLMSMVGAKALAFDAKIDGIYYNFSGTEAIVTYYSDNSSSNKKAYSGSVVIPESVTYNGTSFSVTSIGEEAFSGCSDLTSVTIPNSVTSIGASAFYTCYDLTSVNISDLTAWFKIRFENSSANPLSYTQHLYLNGEEIKDLVIPNSITSIGSYAFYGYSGLTSVTIPNSVTSIGEEAFTNCYGLTSVNISDLEAWCKIRFENNSANPLYWAHHLYLNGEEVTELVFPNSVTSIGNYAFYGCSGLTSVTIPNSVTSIGEEAFTGCSALTSVTIPNSVKSIGNYAFNNCSGLTSVTIGNSVTSIGNYAFYGTAIYNNAPDGVFYVDKWACGYKGKMNSGVLSLAEGTQGITDYAFNHCSDLTSVTIPNSVTSIGSSAFCGCI